MSDINAHQLAPAWWQGDQIVAKQLAPVLASLAFLVAAPAHGHAPSYAPGTVFTNMENAYFAQEEGRTQPDWVALRFNGTAIEAIDAFGEPAEMPDDFAIIAHGEDDITARINGVETQLRRARAVSCWGAVRRPGEVPDGESAWVFNRNLMLFDQGGRAAMGGTGDLPLAVLRIRRVTWATGSNNRPSLVLYVHEARDDMSALSYSWADGEATRVGINLRWMQASCSIEGAERPRNIAAENLRG